jgi:hypothetical protein
MFLKPRKASTDPRLRSLLQKAVRRGVASVVERVAVRLDAIGDTTWLRSRAIVITFEESWPLARGMSVDRHFASKLGVLLKATESVKQKDAAGLGALAHAYREGDTSMLARVPDQRALRIVAEALERPKEFFDWIHGEARSQPSGDIVDSARRYLPAATWDWDKACILAGALLATTADYSSFSLVEAPRTEEAFPYWVALDKHTDEGKAAIKSVAKEVKTTYRELIWVSFYCESAQVNKLAPSPWFEAERSWRLGRVGMSWDSASELWARARPLIRARLEEQALALKVLVESSPADATSSQRSLL